MSQPPGQTPTPNESNAPCRPATDSAGVEKILSDLRPMMRAHALALTNGNPHAADEILQESLLYIWHRGEALPVSEKLPVWAARVVYFKALSYRRDRSREPFTGFSPELMEHLAQAAPEHFAYSDAQIAVLAECLNAMPPDDAQLLHRHYRENFSLKTIAENLGKNENTLWQKFFRLRNALRRCVEKKLRGVRNEPPPA